MDYRNDFEQPPEQPTGNGYNGGNGNGYNGNNGYNGGNGNGYNGNNGYNGGNGNGYNGNNGYNGGNGNGYNGNNGYNGGNGYNGNNGYNVYQGPQVIVGEPDNSGSSTFAVVSLVLGILGLVFVCCLYWLSLIMGIIGLVLGIISLVQNRDGKGLAIAGTVLNGLSVLISILLLVLVLTMGIGLEDWTGSYMNNTQYEKSLELDENVSQIPASPLVITLE